MGIWVSVVYIHFNIHISNNGALNLMLQDYFIQNTVKSNYFETIRGFTSFNNNLFVRLLRLTQGKYWFQNIQTIVQF